MSDDNIVSTVDEIAGQEGSIDTLENATLEYLDEPRLVPERDLLAVKDKAQRKDAELKEARARIAELEASKSVSPLAQEFEWVDEAFLAAVERRTEQKLQEHLAPLLSQQKKSAFDKQFDEMYDRHLAKAENVDASKVDKEVIKALTLSPQYRGVPPKDIIEKLYKTEPTGRATTENDMRPATELVKDVVDVDNVSKEQLARIYADPKALKAFLDKKYT